MPITSQLSIILGYYLITFLNLQRVNSIFNSKLLSCEKAITHLVEDLQCLTLLIEQETVLALSIKNFNYICSNKATSTRTQILLLLIIKLLGKDN